MKSLLPDFKTAKVVVIGDIILDRYWHGQTHRISPEAPVPVVKVDSIEERPGGAANVAMNISSLGASVRLIGLVGKDDAATTLNVLLEKGGVTCDLINVPTHPTITKLRILSKNQQLLRLDFETNFDTANALEIQSRLTTAMRDTTFLILSDYAKGALSNVQTLIKSARAAGVMVLIDPKGTDFKRYQGAFLLTPNLGEFEAVAGKCKNDTDMVERGMAMLAKYDFNALLITRSENGMTLLQRGTPPLHLPAQAQEVYDVTGAGDTVIALLATALATGSDLESACFLANLGAGIVVGKSGTSCLTVEELIQAIHARPTTGFGVLTEEQLKKVIHTARQRGETLVMTNGCFDLLHAGHIAYLTNARKLGNRLIVAVNSDTSVKRLKGKNRPINTLIDRMAVLAALSSVDWVVSFDENTPERLIAEILPDILVKGGDYEPEAIVGAQIVQDNGGKVQVLNFEAGFSTTGIIQKILSDHEIHA